MTEPNSNYLMQFPFSNLTDSEFRAVTASWHFDLSNCSTDLFDIILNPNKFDDRDSDTMPSSPSSKYYTINKLNNSLNTLINHNKSISLFHCNIRSLPRNLCLLEDFIYSLDVKPDILGSTDGVCC